MTVKITRLTDFTNVQLESLVLSIGKPEYRLKQLQNWIYRELTFSFQNISELPPAFQEMLEKENRLHNFELTRQVTGYDGTVKAPFSLANRRMIEIAQGTEY